MKSMIAGLALALGGCNLVLGLSEPNQQGDGGIPSDSPDDAAVPGTVRINMGGTGIQGIVTSVPEGITCPGTCEFTFPVGTEVALSATLPANSTFTGFFQGGCTGGQTCTITPAGMVDVFARYFTPENIWFTSSQTYKPGAFDGVANADLECDRLAAEAGLIERTYIAWLPSTTKTAKQHLLEQVTVGAAASVWRRPDGKLFAVSANDIQQGQIRFPPRLDEFGRDVGDDALVVTDTLGNGSGMSNAGSHCSDWASETGTGILVGEAAGGTGRFTEVGISNCSTPAHLYCLSAVDNAAVAVEQLSNSVVYLTFPTVRGDATLAAMDTLCASEGQTIPGGISRALVTPGGGGVVKDRFVGVSFSPDPVMRPDGVVIASNMDALLAGESFAAAPNVVPDLEYRNDSVWIGGGSFASFTSDCAGWTSSGGFGTTRFAATTRDATFTQQDSCGQERHLLCFKGQVAMAKPTPPAADNRRPQATRSKR